MAFRFFRRIRLAPGLSLNLTKRGGSLSLGPRGAKLTAGTSGVRRTVGLPGTGLWYTEKLGNRGSSSRSRRGRARRAGTNGPHRDVPAVRPEERLDLGFFKRLLTPQDEEDFVDGMREVVLGREGKALEHLRRAAHLPDAAFMAGMLALKTGRFEEAKRLLVGARRKHAGLGRHFARYGIDAAVSLPITERIHAQVAPSPRGILLALAEAHQATGEWREAVRDLSRLHEEDPRDPVVLLSLVELLVEEAGGQRACRRVVELAKGVENESELHAAILLWKGVALRRLGLPTAARDALTAAFRRKKGRDEELLRAIRYERALVYEELGRKKRAREELERLYAEAPDHETWPGGWDSGAEAGSGEGSTGIARGARAAEAESCGPPFSGRSQPTPCPDGPEPRPPRVYEVRSYEYPSSCPGETS